MSINHFFIIGFKKSRIEKRNLLVKFLSLFFILTFLFSFLFISENFNQNNYSINRNLTNTNEIFKKDGTLESAGDPVPLVQDPFTINFSNIRDYFNPNFKTNLPFRDNDLNIISTYFRDEFSKDVYSVDNLLLYKSLEKTYTDEFDKLKAYVDLSSTPLWFDGNSTHYGFVRTIDGTTGDVKNDDRYLIDNLMPIFLMLENIDGNNINTINFLGETPKSIVEKTFTLTNSSQFRDTANGGFFQFNSSSGKKDTKSIFYSILSNLLIHDFKNELGSIANDAYDSAHDAIVTVIDNLWDNTNEGFYNRSNSDWTSGLIDRRKCLDTNALGIIALVDFWIENESMNSNSLYLKNATSLYEKMSTPFGPSGGLWDPTNKAYQFALDDTWNDIGDNRFDLEANSLMMQACLKLFEATGNITYYNRAFDLYNTFENQFYDSSVNAYRTSIGPINNNKNFSSNLMLADAYLKAVELYYSTVLDATFNTSSQVPDFIIDQDVLNLTCDYAFEKTISHSNPLIGPGSNLTRYNNITGASITYIFYYPNNTIIDIKSDTINDNTTTLLYPITESLPIDNGYSITIYANTTNFGIALINKTFNIISGLESHPIQGLDDVDLYQGRTVNITLPVNNTRNDHITLNVTLVGFGIENYTLTNINVNFTRYILTNVSFNLTIKDDATPGKRNLSFIFKNGSILYLEVVKEIEIVNALTYSNLIYRNKIVAGNRIQISMNLINFFPNTTQSFNVSFSGNYINDVKLPAFLTKNQMKTVFYDIFSASWIPEDSIEVEMSISVGETIFYSKILTVEIIPKFEIISLEFSEDVIQGVNPHIIIIIQNNLDSSEEFTLIINDVKVSTDLDELSPGENRIEYEIERFYNPYEFGTKTVLIEIEDESGDSIVKEQFEYEVRISAINLIFFYLFPILIPIAVILYYKNKDIKNKLLRR